MKKIVFYLISVAVVLIAACDETKDIDQYMYTVKAPVTGVALDQTKLELARNDKATLKATITPDRAINKEVKWSSNNESIATVSEDGEVSGISLGKANITVTTEDGGKTATCEVTVTEATATGVALDKSALELKVGEGAALTATVSPDNTSNKQLTWSSDNEAVATVNPFGDVKALAPGKANITVTTVSGGKKETCAVTVIQPVTGVKLSGTEVPVLIGSSITLKATVEPANATNKDVKWRITGKGVVITDYDTPGEVTIKRTGEGEAVVIAITDDGAFEASCKVTEKPFYPNILDPFEATLGDNFEWGEGYSGQVVAGSTLFAEGDILKGSIFELEMEFTVSRDLERDEIYVILVDPSPPSWWTVKANVTDAGSYKAGQTISRKIKIVTTEDTNSSLCNLHFETWGVGTQGTPGSGVKGPVTFKFTKFIWNKLVE